MPPGIPGIPGMGPERRPVSSGCSAPGKTRRETRKAGKTRKDPERPGKPPGINSPGARPQLCVSGIVLKQHAMHPPARKSLTCSCVIHWLTTTAMCIVYRLSIILLTVCSVPRECRPRRCGDYVSSPGMHRPPFNAACACQRSTLHRAVVL